MWARIKNNKVIEIINFNPKGKFHKSIIWHKVPLGTKQGWTSDGQNWFPPEIVTPVEILDEVEAAQLIKKAEVTRIAKDKRANGTTFNNIFLDTDVLTRVALKDAYDEIMEDNTLSFDWLKSDGKWITIDITNVKATKDSVRSFIQSSFTAQRKAHGDIDKKLKVSTVEEYEIDI